MNSQISDFAEDLFSNKTLELERTMLSKEENDILGEKIVKCLICLLPHLLLRAAQKCLEWLLRRFHIGDVQVCFQAILMSSQQKMCYKQTFSFITKIKLIQTYFLMEVDFLDSHKTDFHEKKYKCNVQL